MARFLLRFGFNVIGIYIASLLLEGINLTNYSSLVTASLVLIFFNAKVRPFLVAITLPINILTVGIFTFVINAVIFWTSALITPGLTAGIISSLFGAILINIVTFIGDVIYEEHAGIYYGGREGRTALPSHKR